MSHSTHPHVSSPIHLSRRTAWLAALLTLAAMVTVTLVIAIGDDSTVEGTSAQGGQVQQSLVSGGPKESAVAANVGSRASAGPSESTTAAAVSASSPSAQASTGGPDESSTAAAISGR